MQLAGKTNFRYTIVTVQGEILHPGGALTGGSLGKTAGKIIGRKNKVRQLTEEIAGLEETILSLNKEKEGIEKAVAAEREKVRLIGSRVTQCHVQLRELETGMEYRERQIQSLERENLIRGTE